MSGNIKNRAYEMTNRERAARATRRRIVDAAARLFVRDGYSETSIADIAAAADVAVPTVYAGLRSKANILRAVVESTLRGDHEGVPLGKRAAWKEMEAEEDAHEKLAAFARIHTGVCEREAPVFAQLEAAAGSDAEATELLAEHDRKRYETQSKLARNLQRAKQLKAGLTARRAADCIWTIASERTYLALVAQRGWKPAQYERWVAQQLEAALLPS